MKKLILLIAPILILMNACNNKSQSGENGSPSADSSKVTPPAPSASASTDTTVSGGGATAIVYVDKTNNVGVSSITVQAMQNGKVVGKGTSDGGGNYTISGLTKGNTYSFIAITDGKIYKNDTVKNVVYDGTIGTLPAIPLDSVGK